jgi:hypothetical protein
MPCWLKNYMFVQISKDSNRTKTHQSKTMSLLNAPVLDGGGLYTTISSG